MIFYLYAHLWLAMKKNVYICKRITIKLTIMKKVLLSVLSSLCLCFGASAQTDIFNNPENRAYFGLRLSGEVTCPGNVSSHGMGVGIYGNGAGVEFGGIYNVPVIANFYVEPGLNLYYNTYSVKDKYLGNVVEDVNIDGMSIRKFGMRIPVMAGYRFDFTPEISVSVFTGPELEVGFSAKGHISSNRFDASEDLYGDDGGMNRVDVLWGIGAGLSYQNLYFGLKGSMGMCNMYKESVATFHENRVSFSVGYNF